HALPAARRRLRGEIAAHQRAAQRAAAVDHQHLALTRLGDGDAHLRVVLGAGERGDLAVKRAPPAVIAEYGRRNQQLRAVFITQIAGGEVAHCGITSAPRSTVIASSPGVARIAVRTTWLGGSTLPVSRCAASRSIAVSKNG